MYWVFCSGFPKGVIIPLLRVVPLSIFDTSRGMNGHPTPRVDNVKEYLKTLQRRDAQREREQFADKGRDTLLDGMVDGQR
jgi:hypothetical protein